MQNISGIHSVEIRECDEIFVPAGNSRTSFIDARDIGLSVATVLHEAEKYKNTAHTITGPESLSYFQIAEILSQITGRKIEYKKPGFLKYRKRYVKKRGLDRNYVNVTLALYFMTRLGTAGMITEEFSKITGMKPRTFRQFVEDHIDCF
jgi:nucleoside-diphosphate-sugar epimerase